MYYWAGLALQEAGRVVIELMIYFHDYIIVILTMILSFVGYMFLLVSSSSILDIYVVESHFLELV